MLTLGLSTWAETPEPTRSDSHAWSAHPTLDLLTIVAGIAPGSPGFRSVSITPHLGSLQHVDAAMPTPKGLVTVHYTRENSRWKAAVTLPAGLPGAIVWHDQSITLHPGRQEMELP
jgi:alpha-L-rhamnosidase